MLQVYQEQLQGVAETHYIWLLHQVMCVSASVSTNSNAVVIVRV